MTDVKIYHVYHQDRLSNLTPFLILDRGRVWYAGKKNGKYYLFITETVYIKLWRDKKRNLVMYIGNITKPMYTEEPDVDVFETDIVLNYIDYIEDAMYIGNDYFKFTFPIIGIVRRLNQGATRPLVYLLYRLLTEQAHEETSAEPQEEAETPSV